MDNTIIQQGSFTATGSTVRIPLRSGVDWMKVYNVTIAAASQTTAVGVEYYWQLGFPAGAKWTYFKSNAANAANLSQYLTSNGFTYYDSSTQSTGTLQSTITAISASATPPVVTNTGTNGLVAGDVVRLTNVASAQQLGGFDFTVGYNTISTTTFSLDYMSALALAGTTGSFRKINFDPIFYPRRRIITKVASSGIYTVVTLSVTHRYTVGQQVRLVVPAIYGMVELDGLQGTILSINTNTSTGNTITLDIDSSSFTAFAFPVNADVPFTPSEVIPFGENTAEALLLGVDILGDSTENIASIGMSLAGGASNPGGAASDVVYWVAGKSFSNTVL